MFLFNASDLLQFKLFSTLKKDDILPLLPYIREKNCRRGQILFVEGEIGSHVYFLLRGQVKLSKTLPNGEEQILEWCGQYDSFAEILLLETGSYPVTAEVIQDSVILVLSNEIIPSLLEKHPNLAMAIIRTLNRRLRLAQEFSRILTSKSKAGILGAILLRLARPAPAPDKSIYVPSGLTHKDLAGMIGTSREVVNRSINTWKKSGIINIVNGSIEILKPQELADWP